MSKDYPNREDWLKVRATPRKLKRDRYAHVSKPLVLIKNGSGSFETVVSPMRGSTFVKPAA